MAAPVELVTTDRTVGSTRLARLVREVSHLGAAGQPGQPGPSGPSGPAYRTLAAASGP